MLSVELTEKIREEIIDAGVDDRYRPGAYEFILHGIEFYRNKIGEKRHVSGQELSIGLLMFAHVQYGLMAKSVLNRFGIKTTEDFGCIVYNLINIGLVSKRPEDSLDDFVGVTDIGKFFELANRECFSIDKEFLRKPRN